MNFNSYSYFAIYVYDPNSGKMDIFEVPLDEPKVVIKVNPKEIPGQRVFFLVHVSNNINFHFPS